MLRLAYLLLGAVALVSSSVIRPHHKTHGTKLIPAQVQKVVPYAPVGTCPNPQGNLPVYLPDSERCDVYYECSNGVSVQNFCTAGLEWNPTLNTCDRPEQANCQAGKPKKTPKIIHPFSPVGECHGHEDGTPTYLPDSDNCKIYYECNNGIAVQNVCPDGLEWNAALHVCDFPENANCEAGKPKKSPEAIHPFSPVGECHGHEDGTPTYLPDSDDCQIYYECNNGIAVPNSCPGELQWNAVLHVCDFPDVVKCEKSKKIDPLSIVGECPIPQGPTPVCLPDDQDCSAFYKCFSGVPIKLYCGPGTLFDSDYRRCVMASQAKCQSG